MTIQLNGKYIFEPFYPEDYEEIDYATPGALVTVVQCFGKSGDEDIYAVVFDNGESLMVGECDLQERGEK